ncbi:hypothetical protein [Lysobacter gummosus]|uniref:hypothetical protein n=1 Tax=Lysobacter gummosus TaxID=262324 RepID=UPI00362B8CD4
MSFSVGQDDAKRHAQDETRTRASWRNAERIGARGSHDGRRNLDGGRHRAHGQCVGKDRLAGDQ